MSAQLRANIVRQHTVDTQPKFVRVSLTKYIKYTTLGCKFGMHIIIAN